MVDFLQIWFFSCLFLPVYKPVARGFLMPVPFTVQDEDMLPCQGTISYNADIVYIYTRYKLYKIRCSHSVLKFSFQSNTSLFTITSVYNVWLVSHKQPLRPESTQGPGVVFTLIIFRDMETKHWHQLGETSRRESEMKPRALVTVSVTLLGLTMAVTGLNITRPGPVPVTTSRWEM